MHWQPEGLHGDEGEEVEHPVLLEEISWVLKVSGLPVAVSSLPYPTIPYHTLPYPTLPNFPKITGEDLVPPATFEIEVQSLAASTSLLTVSSFNGSLHGHLNPGAEHCLHGAPCVGPGL